MPSTVSQLSRGQGHEFLCKLEAAGLDPYLAQKVVDSKDNELASSVVRFIERGGFEPSASQKRAEEIMGQNFFGVGEAIKYFGVSPTKHELAELWDIPFPDEMLVICKDTHVLVAVLSVSIIELRKLGRSVPNLFDPEYWWYKRGEFAFAKHSGEVGWHLVRKTEVPNSGHKTWAEQRNLLAKGEAVPTAQVLTYSIIGYYLATGNRLFNDISVQTSSTVPIEGRDYHHVCIGRFDQNGLSIATWFPDVPGQSTGLASEWSV